MESRLTEQDGRLLIEVAGEKVLPFAYITYCPDAQRYANFREIGIRLFSVGVYASDQGINSYSGIRPFRPGFFVGNDSYDFTFVAEDLERIAPDGKGAFILPRVYLDSPVWWENQHPDELCRDVRGEAMRQSFGSPVWRKDMCKALRAFIDFVEQSPWRDAVIGYQVAAGGTEEWAYHRRFLQQLGDYSAGNLHRYQEWLCHRYGQIASLNQAYASRYSGFDQVPLPTPLQRLYCRKGVLRSLPDEAAAVDYYAYHNYLIADTILYFCRHVKEYTERRLLTGAFYGYVTEIMNTDVGHHCLMQVLQSPDIDFLASPNSYLGVRSPDNDWPFMSAVDSARLHRKLWFVESDTRTVDTKMLKDSLPDSCPDSPIYEGGVWSGPETLEMSLSLLKRNIGRVLTGHTGTWWFDMWGGWFDSPEVMQLIKQAHSLLDQQTAQGLQAEIAVVIDEDGFRYFGVDQPVLYQLIYEQRRELGVLGTPYHLYLAEDLSQPSFDADAYKMVIFLNCVSPSIQVVKGIDRLKSGGRTLVWVYFEDAPQGGSCTGCSWQYDPSAPAMQGVYGGQLFPPMPVSCPRFTQEEPGEYVLARFSQGQEPCVVWRNYDNYQSVYSLLPRLPAGLLADIATLSGVHLYNRSGELVYAGGKYLFIQAMSEGYKRLYFPQPIKKVTNALTGEEMRINGMFMDFPMKQYDTRIFQFEF